MCATTTLTVHILFVNELPGMHGLSRTAYCKPNEQRVLLSGASHIFAYGCEPCPGGTRSWGGLSTGCYYCDDLQCLSTNSSREIIEGRFDVTQLNVTTGDEIRVKVEVKTGAARAPLQGKAASTWIKVRVSA